eukprot:m.19061 g.19061  ORF g.19061 m.19061 type:complete len:228 (+) comp12323_c0_seq2:336-1019(+)
MLTVITNITQCGVCVWSHISYTPTCVGGFVLLFLICVLIVHSLVFLILCFGLAASDDVALGPPSPLPYTNDTANKQKEDQQEEHREQRKTISKKTIQNSQCTTLIRTDRRTAFATGGSHFGCAEQHAPVAAVHVRCTSETNVEREQRAIVVLHHERTFSIRVVPPCPVFERDVRTKRADGEVGERHPVSAPRMPPTLHADWAASVTSVDVSEHVVVTTRIDEHVGVF